MSGQGKVKLQRAKVYILSHPDQSKREQQRGAAVSHMTISTARKELQEAGLLPQSRKGLKGSEIPPRTPEELVALADQINPPPPPPPAVQMSPLKVREMTQLIANASTGDPALLDHAAMQALATMDADEDLDDEVVYRRMLKQAYSFAFNPKLHPDTRMSASTMWDKLRARAKTQDLGPGLPMTFSAGVERLAELMKACGTRMVLAAIDLAFDKEKPDGQTPNNQTSSVIGTEEAPSTT